MKSNVVFSKRLSFDRKEVRAQDRKCGNIGSKKR
tara:strand:+ start:1132 stop:1233 length:102 start_codon:yes stop_codon:yes gene_type:complete